MLKRSLLLLIGLLIPMRGVAANWQISKATARFDGKGPAGFKLNGTTESLDVADDGRVVRITVLLASLKTGIALRDRHMREKYLQVDRFPDAVLQVAWEKIRLPEDLQHSDGKAPATMSLHGVTKELGVSFSIQRSGPTFQVSGSVSLNLKDFGIEVPSYMGLTVGPDIEASATFSATRG